MPKKSSIAIFIAATSALAISTVDSNSVKSGENDLGGLKEWNTDMALDADFKLDAEAQRIADEAAKSSACIPIGEGENCWEKRKKNTLKGCFLMQFKIVLEFKLCFDYCTSVVFSISSVSISCSENCWGYSY